MFFKYPDKFIVPVDLFRREEDKNKIQIKIDTETNIEELREKYKIDKEIWKNIDCFYSKNETGTFDDN